MSNVTQFLIRQTNALNSEFNSNISPKEIEELSTKIETLLDEFCNDLYSTDEGFTIFMNKDEGYANCEFQEKLFDIIKGNLF